MHVGGSEDRIGVPLVDDAIRESEVEQAHQLQLHLDEPPQREPREDVLKVFEDKMPRHDDVVAGDLGRNHAGREENGPHGEGLDGVRGPPHDLLDKDVREHQLSSLHAEPRCQQLHVLASHGDWGVGKIVVQLCPHERVEGRILAAQGVPALVERHRHGPGLKVLVEQHRQGECNAERRMAFLRGYGPNDVVFLVQRGAECVTGDRLVTGRARRLGPGLPGHGRVDSSVTPRSSAALLRFGTPLRALSDAAASAADGKAISEDFILFPEPVSNRCTAFVAIGPTHSVERRTMFMRRAHAARAMKHELGKAEGTVRLRTCGGAGVSNEFHGLTGLRLFFFIS